MFVRLQVLSGCAFAAFISCREGDCSGCPLRQFISLSAQLRPLSSEIPFHLRGNAALPGWALAAGACDGGARML